MIDNKELERIMDILENLEDEELSVKLLKEFNERTSRLGKLIMNKDSSLSHEEWKKLCEDAKDEVDFIIKKIEGLS